MNTPDSPRWTNTLAWARALDWVRRCMIEYPGIGCTAMIGNCRLSYSVGRDDWPIVQIYLVAEEKK